MADVFVSYSRRDSAFVRRVVDGLQERGKDVWVDTDGIRDAEVFPAALKRAVEQSDGFLFVITPASVASTFCEQEVDHALELNKRIVPLLRTAVPDEELPAGVRERNWIPFDDEQAFAGALQRVVDALDTDLDWAREHTRWLVKALDWETEGKDRSFLLRGAELTAAEAWLGRATGKEPEPTALQRTYVSASRSANTRRLRRLATVSAGIAVLAVALLVFALISRRQAIDERTTASSRALAAESQNHLSTDPVLSILLAREAFRAKDTPEARFALRGALDASPLRTILPPAPRECAGLWPVVAFVGESVAEALCNGDVRLLDADTGKRIWSVDLGPQAREMQLSPDGTQLAVTTTDNVALLDPATGKVERRLTGGGAGYAALDLDFSDDGRTLAAATGAQLRVWDLTTGRGRALLRGPGGDEPSVVQSVFLPSSRRLATVIQVPVDGRAPGVYVVDLRSGEVQRSRDDASVFWAGADLEPAPGGRLAATDNVGDGNGTVSVWDAEGPRERKNVIRAPYVEFSRLAYSPDGTRLAVGATDGTIGLYSVAGANPLLTFAGHTGVIGSLAFDRTGDRIATGSQDGTARVWRARGAEESSIDAGPHGSVGVTVGADRVTVIGLDRVESWRASDGRKLPAWRLPPGGWGLSDDATVAAQGNERGTELFRAPQTKPVRTLGSEPNTWALVEANGARVAVLSYQQPSKVFRVAGGEPVTLAGKTNPDCPSWRGAQFSADGRWLAAGGYCGHVYVWDAATGRLVSSFTNPRGQLDELALVPGGTRLVVSSLDGSVTLWDWRARRTVHALVGHTRSATSVAASADGALVATSSLDGTVRVWDSQSARMLRVLRLPAAVVKVGFTPDGRRLVTYDATDTIRIWEPCPNCDDGPALMRESDARVARELTPLERATYLG